MIAPTGEAFLFDEKNSVINNENFNRVGGTKIRSLSTPLSGIKALPCDKKLKYSRYGKNSNYSDTKPQWMPNDPYGVNPQRRAGY